MSEVDARVFVGVWMLYEILLCFFVFFFFQAEDGIRDAQESRGLGDVYKRQTVYAKWNANPIKISFDPQGGSAVAPIDTEYDAIAVSYTHLTLPTIYSV